MTTAMTINWARVKRLQALDAEQLAAVASGIGEYGIANACYRLAEILRQQAVVEKEAVEQRATGE
jgi:hypothetical protein